MNPRKTIVGGLIAIGGILGFASTASAHTFNHTPACAGLSWSATLYNGQATNSITVTIDGAVAYSDPNFGTTDTGSLPWSQTSNHTYSIVVDAPGTQYDHNVSGTQQACQTTTVPTTTTTTTMPPTTTICVDCTPGTQVIIPTTTTTQPPPGGDDPGTTTTTVSPTGGEATTTTTPNPADPATTTTTVATTLPSTGNNANLAIIAICIGALGTILVRAARRP